MIYLLVTLGFVISVVIFIYRDEKYGANFYLSLFLFCNTVYSLTSFSLFTPDFRWFVAMVQPYVILFNMSAGPFMYLYFLRLFNTDFQFKKIHLLHFLPAVLFFINGSSYIFVDPVFKSNLIKNFLIDPGIGINLPTLFLPFYAHVVFRFLQTSTYLVLCMVLFLRFNNSKAFQISSGESNTINFLHVFLFAFTGHFVMSIFIGIRFNPAFDIYFNEIITLDALVLTSRYFFAFFILSTLFNPKVIFQKFFILQLVKKNHLRDKIFPNESSGEGILKYDIPNIENLFIDILDRKVYLEPGFSLTNLSEILKIPVHQVSYFIKVTYGTSFNDWKNGLRVNHAIELIESGRANVLTLESISIECGYRSRANFIDAFKKMMNKTPSEYLAEYRKLS